MSEIRKLVPIPSWPEDYPSQASWRWMRFNSNHNGMDEAGVFVQIGKRVLVDPEAFYRWAAENGGKPLSGQNPKDTEGEAVSS